MIETIIAGTILFIGYVGLWYMIFKVMVAHKSAKRAQRMAAKQRLLRSGVKRV